MKYSWLFFSILLSNVGWGQSDTLPLFPWCQKAEGVLLSADGYYFEPAYNEFDYPEKVLPKPKLAAYEQYGLYGFKDESGAVIIPAGSEEVGTYREGYVWIKLDHKRYLYLDSKNEPLVEYTFDRCFDFQEGRARVLDFNSTKAYHGYGFIDTLGQVAIPLVYEQAFDFVGCTALVKDSVGWWLINQAGEKIVGPNPYLRFEQDRFSCKVD